MLLNNDGDPYSVFSTSETGTADEALSTLKLESDDVKTPLISLITGHCLGRGPS
jgi:hypothetical protein